ncbi:MAG: hypothetical protein PVH12_08360 [Candidatus Bathyarchaeota archaeon]
MELKRILIASFLVLLVMFSLTSLLQIEVSFSHQSVIADVDLEYFAHHMDDYLGMEVKTEGIVKFFFSIYMYEDFWLAAKNNEFVAIPVLVRETGLLSPPENTSIQILGTVEYSFLEGGFYYLRAQEFDVIPEFPSLLILPLLILSNLLAILVYRRRQNISDVCCL